MVAQEHGPAVHRARMAVGLLQTPVDEDRTWLGATVRIRARVHRALQHCDDVPIHRWSPSEIPLRQMLAALGAWEQQPIVPHTQQDLSCAAKPVEQSKDRTDRLL